MARQTNIVKNYRKVVIIIFFLILTAFFVILCSYLIRKTKNNAYFKDHKTIYIKLNKRRFLLYVADDPQKREGGLSGIPSLRNDEGMIFLFQKPDYYSFWMKDMGFPLDFIFIRNYEIVDLLENIQPETYPKTFTSKKPADKVIEINAKEIKKLRIKIGDIVKFFN